MKETLQIIKETELDQLYSGIKSQLETIGEKFESRERVIRGYITEMEGEYSKTELSKITTFLQSDSLRGETEILSTLKEELTAIDQDIKQQFDQVYDKISDKSKPGKDDDDYRHLVWDFNIKIDDIHLDLINRDIDSAKDKLESLKNKTDDLHDDLDDYLDDIENDLDDNDYKDEEEKREEMEADIEKLENINNELNTKLETMEDQLLKMEDTATNGIQRIKDLL